MIERVKFYALFESRHFGSFNLEFLGSHILKHMYTSGYEDIIKNFGIQAVYNNSTEDHPDFYLYI